MSETQLNKEFSQRDVQRMRNLITGDLGGKTQTQVGYEKQTQNYQEGDIWEADGKKWTIKNGIKQTVTKYDKLKRLVVLPLSCPNCGKAMKVNEYNKKMYALHSMCFDCVIEFETKLRQEGKYEEYEKQIANNNKNSFLDEALQALENFENHKETYVSEGGDIESWSGGQIDKEELKKWKADIKKLKEQQI